MMAESAVFDHVCAALESATSLDRLEARGTVRLALKSAGLAAASVSSEQMHVVLERVLPGELETRGVGDAAASCASIAGGLDSVASLTSNSASAESPEAVFGRLGGA